MNRIVKEHYPASKLPEDLREGLDPDGKVTVTVIEEVPVGSEAEEREPMTLEEIFAYRFIAPRSMDEIDEAMRKLRDEWDDR